MLLVALTFMGTRLQRSVRRVVGCMMAMHARVLVLVLSGSVDAERYSARKFAAERLRSTGNQNDEREYDELSMHCLQYMAHVAQWTWGVDYSSARRSS
jgi:hypothetical protein